MKLPRPITAGACCLVVLLTSIIAPEAYSSHTLTASPAGGTYSSPQSVSLSSSNSSALIYFTTDGSDPTNSSLQYDGTEIVIAANTTLKFIAVLPDNHTTAVAVETYIISAQAPTVINTEPELGERRVGTSIKVNATFDRPIDDSTLNTDSFSVGSESFEDPVFGIVTYDPGTNTATFIPDLPLEPGVVYTVTLSSSILDTDGNPLQPFSWNFTTGGRIEIQILDAMTFEPIAGSAFTLTPDPFQLTESRTVEDNGPLDFDFLIFGSQVDGEIILENVDNNFTTYRVSETTVPDGYSKIYGDVILTVTQVDHCDFCGGTSFVSIQNIPSSVSITDLVGTIDVPRPYLNITQFELYENNVIIGIFSGKQGDILPTFGPIVSPNSDNLPAGEFVTAENVDALTDRDSFNFLLTAAAGTSGEDIIKSFQVPTYPGPDSSVAADIIYSVPALVIPYEGSKNNFVLTPVIDQVFPGLQLFMKQASFVETEVAKFERINMTLNVEGNDVGFIFGISDAPPPGTPDPPLDVPALFLDIGFVGNIDFSDPAAFQTSPKIDILVNKTLPGFPELPNGCPDFRLLFFNGVAWEEVQKLNPTGNFTDFCPFTLEPEHFSKFAVGGVKGQTISTENPPSDEERRSGGGGGGSRSTGITSMPTGNDIETTVTTQSGTVNLEFESVQSGSGQLTVDTGQLSSFENIFDDMALMAQDNDEHGIVRLNGETYSTAGSIFDIDASEVNYRGTVQVTIPYDERTVNLLSGSEGSVRFLHYDEETGLWDDATLSVDELANTVIGVVDSLSPVVAAVIISGGITFDEEYFEDNPLARMEVTNPSFSISEQGEIGISASLNNRQGINQEYVVIVQILDENGIAQYIEWERGSLASGGNGEFSMTWKPDRRGTYIAEIFVLTEMESPDLLSKAVSAEMHAPR